MSQSRPSRPSDRNVEHIRAEEPATSAGPDDSGEAAPTDSDTGREGATPDSRSDPATGAGRQGAIPSQQSRPGPEDDIMLATGRKRAAPQPTQEQIRRQPGRRAWVPNQHGA